MDKLIIIRTDNQNNLYEQIISLITANQAKMETMSFGVFPTLFFPGLEIRQSQRRVFQDGEEVNPALNTAPLYSLLPIPALSSHRHRFLKPFGTWIAIAAIQVLST